MTESIFLTTPILWICYTAALFLCVFDLIKKTSWIFSAVSMLIAVATTAYALLLGADFLEACFVVLCFLALNLLGSWRAKK